GSTWPLTRSSAVRGVADGAADHVIVAGPTPLDGDVIVSHESVDVTLHGQPAGTGRVKLPLPPAIVTAPYAGDARNCPHGEAAATASPLDRNPAPTSFSSVAVARVTDVTRSK